MFIANSEIRVCGSEAESHGMSEVDVNGSALHGGDSRAMARVESSSVISNGAPISSGASLAVREGKRTSDLPSFGTMPCWPKRREALAAATSHCKEIALTGLLETLIKLEWSRLRYSLLRLFMTAERAEGFVRVEVSEILAGDGVRCQAVRAPAIPQASNNIRTTIGK